MAASADGSARRAHWRRHRGVYLAVILTALATVAVTALLVNIFEHKQEARQPFYRVVALDENTDDPAVWGKNFPMQYDGYKRTVDQVRTRYGGSEAVPRTPTAADPRSIVAQSRLEEDPAPEDAVGRLRLLEGLPRGARPRLHAGRSDVHRAPAGREAARHLHAVPRVRSGCRTGSSVAAI